MSFGINGCPRITFKAVKELPCCGSLYVFSLFAALYIWDVGTEHEDNNTVEQEDDNGNNANGTVHGNRDAD